MFCDRWCLVLRIIRNQQISECQKLLFLSISYANGWQTVTAINHRLMENSDILLYFFTLYPFSSRELPTTVIELDAMAIAAKMGLRSRPVKG